MTNAPTTRPSQIPVIVGATIGSAIALGLVIVAIVCGVSIARRRKQRRFLRDDEIFASDSEQKKLMQSM